MIVSLYIYVDGIAKRIEMFEDETVSITSSIQNINDISKVFTDYSNNFTIPASRNNNTIFKHWYENSLDNAFDQRLRYDGFIEIDTQLFRVGKFQLESATIKNNQIEDYKIVFYGNLKSLTDAFGEDKLKDVETLNDYTIEYNGTNVKNSITSTSDLDIHFPLISSERVWEYSAGAGGSNNIHGSAGRIDYTELFPSLKFPRIFDAIASKYNVTFNGAFLSQTRFTNAYLWLKNNEANTFNALGEAQLINFTTTQDDPWIKIDATTDTVSLYQFPEGYDSQLSFTIQINFPISLNYNFIVYQNGAVYTTLNGTASNFSFVIDSNVGLGDYQFELQTAESTTFTFNYTVQYFEYDPFGVSQFITLFTGSGGSTTNNNIDLTAFAPDIKVADFVSGVLKMFNLTAFSVNGTDFTLEQLENWYYQGQIKDLSEYCITDDFTFERIKPYKKINFKYQKSENFLSRTFFDFNAREFGDLEYNFNNDGADYTIQLPFENILFNKFTGTNIQVGYALKPDFTSYVPKPIVLYKYGNASCDFQFDAGSGHETISNYNVFGQDVLFEGNIHTLNWGIEISSYLLQPINKTLFNNYYLPYLNNLYSLKSRLLKLKMRLSYAQLLDLKLNDRIVIRDKRYIINQFTTNLSTFETDFELVQDFRTIDFNNSSLRSINNTQQALEFYTTSRSGIVWTINDDGDSMIDRITNESDKVIVEINENTTGLERICSIINDDQLIIIKQDA